MSKRSDIGTAQNQPISAEVMEAAQEEITRLRVENTRLRAELLLLRNYDPPRPLPRLPRLPETKEQAPVPVHPSCNVTHRGGE